MKYQKSFHKEFDAGISISVSCSNFILLKPSVLEITDSTEFEVKISDTSASVKVIPL